MWVLVLSYVAVLVAEYGLQVLNLRHLARHGHRVPAELEGIVDSPTLKKIADYTFEKSRLQMIRSLFSSGLVVVFLFGGVLGRYDAWITGLDRGFVTGGIVFLVGLLCVQMFFEIPFSLYGSFGIESRHGFNTMTFTLWLVDSIKAAVVTLGLAVLVGAGALFLVETSPGEWWLGCWIFFLVVGLLLMYISPYVIEPLFFKFKPIQIEGFEDRVRDLAGKVGLQVSRVFQVDASRRSRHTNAYFTGIGRVKRIVLFDTLLEHMSPTEVLATLAHEMGHWKKRHVLKRLVMTQVLAFFVLLGASRLVGWQGLPGLVGHGGELSFYGRVVLVVFIGTLAAFPLTPVFSFLSRRDEWQADEFACQLTGRPLDLDRALAGLSRDNLSNLHPHPLYTRFYDSHPPIPDRMRKLRAYAEQSLGRPEVGT